MGKSKKVQTMTGVILDAYNPKAGRSKFYYRVKDQSTGTIYKGMAYNSLMQVITLGATVEFTGTVNGEWFNLQTAELVSKPETPTVRDTIQLGHVGSPRHTHHGLGVASKTAAGWVTITCRAMREFFDGDTGGDDMPFDFPRRGGLGRLDADIKRNGDTVVVKIHDWQPMTRQVVLDIPFNKVWFGIESIGFFAEGGQVTVPNDRLPFDLENEVKDKLGKFPGSLHFEGTLVATSTGYGKVDWSWDEFEVTVEQSVIEQVNEMVRADAVARATRAVRDELTKLITDGVAVDLTMVVDLFLKKGVEKADARKRAEQVWINGYDARYLRELEHIAGTDAPTWRGLDGFWVQINDWVVWEPCRVNAATYIFPAQPNEDLTGEDLTVAEWVAVLAKTVPWLPKMDLRYHDVGQSLSGSTDGVKFAFHVEADDGSIEGWVNAVKEAVETAPVYDADGSDLMDLDSILALAAENKDDS